MDVLDLYHRTICKLVELIRRWRCWFWVLATCCFSIGFFLFGVGDSDADEHSLGMYVVQDCSSVKGGGIGKLYMKFLR
jgi:hypothetical protein